MFIPDDSFLACLLKVGLVDLERMETRAYDQFTILDEGLFNNEASLLLDERMRQTIGADGPAPGQEGLHQEYASLRKIILDHYEALAAVAVQWASGAVRLLSGGTSSPSSRPSSPPPSRVSFAAAALRLNEGEITRTTDDMSRVRLGHDEVEVYADHAAGNSGAEHPKGALKNPSHDTAKVKPRSAPARPPLAHAFPPH